MTPHPKLIGAGLLLAASGALAAGPAIASTHSPSPTTKVVKYSSCKLLNRVYPHGVGRRGAHDKVSGHVKPVTNFTVNDKVYQANRGLDRDKDGIACEKP